MAESANVRLLPPEVKSTCPISEECLPLGLLQTAGTQPQEVPEARANDHRSACAIDDNAEQDKMCCSVRKVGAGVLKLLGVVSLLYTFICSLDLLSSAFRLMGGKTAGNVFQESELLQNPIAGLMIGVLATVILQSSSTSTSIAITMTSSGIIDVKPAIPIIMGANIGTTVTNTLVSLVHAMDPKEFRRAFSGATVHDVFNWLTVLVLLPLEYFTGYLFHLTSWLLQSLDVKNMHKENWDLLKKLTKPLTQCIVMVDENVILAVAEKRNGSADARLLKTICKHAVRETVVEMNITGTEGNITLVNQTVVTKVPLEMCHSLLAWLGWSDTASGVVLFLGSIVLLSLCLYLMVKLLHSLLGGHVARVTKHVINADFPSPFSCLTGYAAVLVGAAMTVLVQSSSVFTSALTPLVGVGYLKLERMYPLTLGSNIGTTATGILAALASSASTMHFALQLALCHLFFNVTGILFFYPIPCMRHIPLQTARFLGQTTARYRWFAAFYLVIMFLVLPSCLLALSFAGNTVFISVLVLVSAVTSAVAIITILQHSRFHQLLPVILRTWNWLPVWLRSLEPMDKFLRWLFSPLQHLCCMCCLEKCHCMSHRESSSEFTEEDDDVDDMDGSSYEGDLDDDEYISSCCMGKSAGLQRIQRSEIPLQEVRSGIWQKRKCNAKNFAYRPVGQPENLTATPVHSSIPLITLSENML